MEIILATKNKGKVREIAAIMPQHTLYTMEERGFDCDIVEDGASFEENALIKARALVQATGMPCMADDSGLCVEALGGAPGIFSARYAGMDCNDDDNNDLVLANMRGKENRAAYFICVAAIAFPDGTSLTAEGRIDGVLTTERMGTGGFGYDCIFYLPQYGKTTAQLTPEQKNSISHRFIAFNKLNELINKR